VTIPLEDIVLDKLPEDDGKGALTSHLKYFHRAIYPPRVQQKILEQVTQKNCEDIYFHSLIFIREILENFYPQK